MATSKLKGERAKSKVKKSAKKASKKKLGELALASGIGVVSTISITKEMKESFKTGVNNSNVSIKFTYVGSYKRGKLRKKIDRFNSDSNIGLIVTVGGNKAYDAAANRATKPFISLLGAAPSTLDLQCYGGIELRNYALNEPRVQKLTDPSGLDFKRSRIVLYRTPTHLRHAMRLWIGEGMFKEAQS